MAHPSQLVVHFGHEPHTTAHHLVQAFHTLGVHVIPVGAGHRTVRKLPEECPLLWVESGVPSFPTPEELGTHRPNAAWLIDTHRGGRWRSALASVFDTVFVAQRAAVERTAAHGLNVTWLPLACPEPLPESARHDRRSEVAFVGSVTGGSRRERILAALEADFAVDRNRGYVPPDEMMARYARARVVVNIPLARDLNMRLFEAAGAGAYVVTGPMDGLEDVLPRDVVTVVDSDREEDWVRAVADALSCPRTPERAQRARGFIRERHRYTHRAAVILDTLAAAAPRSIPDAARREALRQAAVDRHAFRDAIRIAGPGLRDRAALATSIATELLFVLGRRVRSPRR